MSTYFNPDARLNIPSLAHMLSVLGPDSGVRFEAVLSAWPCTRGINASNNGQVARLADNFAVRFAEGGTGMSKMGTNAQTLLDMIGLPHGLPCGLALPLSLYDHTIIDRRLTTRRTLGF